MQNTEKPLAVSPEKAFRMLDIGRNLGYNLIKEGVIPSVRLGEKRLLVPIAGLERLLATGIHKKS